MKQPLAVLAITLLSVSSALAAPPAPTPQQVFVTNPTLQVTVTNPTPPGGTAYVRTPFRWAKECPPNGTDRPFCESDPYTVPTGSILIIETVTGAISETTFGDTQYAVVSCAVLTSAAPTAVFSFSSLHVSACTFSGRITVYAEEVVRIRYQATSISRQTPIAIAASGYLVPIDSPSLAP